MFFFLSLSRYTFDLWEHVIEIGIHDIHVKVLVKTCPWLGMHVVVFLNWIGIGFN